MAKKMRESETKAGVVAERDDYRDRYYDEVEKVKRLREACQIYLHLLDLCGVDAAQVSWFEDKILGEVTISDCEQRT